MRLNELFALLFTLMALLLVVVGASWFLFNEYYPERRMDCGYFSVNMEAETNDLQLEKGKGRLIKIRMTNVGVEDEFKVTIKDPKWSMVKPKKIRIGQGESTDLFVYVSPTFDADGDHDVVVNLKSHCVDEDFLLKVNVV